MGTVYEAVDPVIQRRVAIKEIRTDPTQSEAEIEETRARFELEFRAAGTLSHPNIVTIYDVGQGAGLYFIAMEKVEGKSLAELLAETPRPPVDWALSIADQVARGLDYAHSRGIVHRDVKPGNVLVAGTDHAKLSDFGLVKTMTSEITTTGTLMGTPAFMSPEQVQGHTLDGRSDQFSLAVICYQMLTGRQPFRADQPAAILYRIVHEEPMPPSRVRPDLPPGLDRVFERALAKDPARRYASCTDLSSALRSAFTSTEPPPRVEPAVSSHRPDTLLLRPDWDAEAPTTAIRRPDSARTGRKGSAAFWMGLAAVAVAGLAGGYWIQGVRGASVAPGERGTLRTEGGSASAQSPESRSHTLRIEAPAGASILRDGEPTGASVPADVVLTGKDSTEVALRLVDREGRPIAERTFVLGPELPETWTPDATVYALVVSTPDGARVFDGQKELGTTPLTVALAPETPRELTLRHDGHHSRTVAVDPDLLAEAAEDERRVEVALTKLPPPGTVRVEAPYAVEVSAAGRRAQTSDGAAVLRLPPGAHQVTLVARSVFLRENRTVDVRSGTTVRIDDLPGTVNLRVQGIPESCVVTIDGFAAGACPFHGRVVTGRHEVEVFWKYQNQRRTRTLDLIRGHLETISIQDP